MWLIICIVFVGLLMMNLTSGGWRQFAEDGLGAIVRWLPVIVIIPVIIAIQWYTVRRHWRKSRAIQRPVMGVVGPDAITWNVEGLSSSRFTWDLLLKFRASDSLLLVYYSPNQVLYFPRHYFAHARDWSDFQNLLATKLPRK